MKTCILSGDRGFIGRHMRPLLEADGYEVIGVDIKDGVDARDFFRDAEQQVDLCIHLAAVVGGRARMDGSPLDLAVNLSLDAEMFSWAQRTKVGKVVYFSSSAVFPVALQRPPDARWLSARPLAEERVKPGKIWFSEPDGLYGFAKLSGETLTKYAKEAGLDVLVVRPFSGYGPDQDLDYPFPSFIARAKRRDDPFEIWGDGTQVRDFIHVEDICQAVLTAVEHGIEGPVNLGTGRGTSFNELAELVTQAAGYSPEFDHRLHAPKGVHTRVGDVTKMLQFYQPIWTLEAGIEQALRS